MEGPGTSPRGVGAASLVFSLPGRCAPGTPGAWDGHPGCGERCVDQTCSVLSLPSLSLPDSRQTRVRSPPRPGLSPHSTWDLRSPSSLPHSAAHGSPAPSLSVLSFPYNLLAAPFLLAPNFASFSPRMPPASTLLGVPTPSSRPWPLSANAPGEAPGFPLSSTPPWSFQPSCGCQKEIQFSVTR